MDQQISFSENFGILMEHPQTAGTLPPREGIRAERREVLPVTQESNAFFSRKRIGGS